MTSSPAMHPLTASEIVAGLVVRIDTTLLRATGGSQTNAQATVEEDRAVTGTHDFLVLAVDAGARRVTATPLFPRSAPGSAPLDDRLRAGPAAWLGQPVFHSRWQHWQIPFDALVAASAEDPCAAGDRRSYAAGAADVLQDLANWASRNRCAFRPVGN